QAGAAELQGRVLLDLQEVTAAEVAVTLLDTGRDGRGLHGRVRRRLGRILGDDDLTGNVGEVAADLAHHEVAGDEADAGVRRVKGERARGRNLQAVVVPGGAGADDVGHRVSLRCGVVAQATLYRAYVANASIAIVVPCTTRVLWRSSTIHASRRWVCSARP